MANNRHNTKRTLLLLFPIVIIILVAGLILGFEAIKAAVQEQFGEPTGTLTPVQRLLFPVELFLHRDSLTSPKAMAGEGQSFMIDPGESVSMVCLRLEREGLIGDAEIMRTYLVYSGLDRALQAGQFQLSPGMSPIQIASELLDATPNEAVVTILPGWRIEEVAANVAGSGFAITQEAFLAAAYAPAVENTQNLPFSQISSLEGFLFPGVYTFPREAELSTVLQTILSAFTNQMDTTLMDGFSRQGLTLYEALTLASIVEKEAVVDEEKPMIASVFYNRLAQGMRLETDPTVQYALGYQQSSQSWWKSPLAVEDLSVESAYNTYQVFGLPPTPICNPGLDSLRAVAFPAETPYFYFRAACDGSGRHLFAITYEEHLNNACE